MGIIKAIVIYNKHQWISRDRGYDPKNDQQVWGSEHGKLVFKRIASYSDEINIERLKQEGKK